MTGYVQRIDFETGLTIIEIPLSKGKVAIIDEADADLVLPHKWSAHVVVRSGGPQHRPQVYAKRVLKNGETLPEWSTAKSERPTLLMHNVVFGGLWCDHRNHDGLDNRRANLRPSDPLTNSRNQRRSGRNTSGFKGAYLSSGRNRWAAEIKDDSGRRWLGYFDTAEEAARAYDAAAREAFGEFAWLNFPDEPDGGKPASA